MPQTEDGGVLAKAFLDIEGGTQLRCLYNPETFTMVRGTNWTDTARSATGVPRLNYTGSTSGTLNLDLMFDTTFDGSAVTRYTDQLVALMEVDPNFSGGSDKTAALRPRTVTFRWGDLHSFLAVMTSLSLTFTYFSSTGVPLRAKATISLKQYSAPEDLPATNPTSGTPRPKRTHRLKPGETLDRVSAHYYGDATRWRVLADANGLHDPLALQAGRLIDVPRLEDS